MHFGTETKGLAETIEPFTEELDSRRKQTKTLGPAEQTGITTIRTETLEIITKTKEYE